MTPTATCPECGAGLMLDARRGVCPRCAVRLALELDSPCKDEDFEEGVPADRMFGATGNVSALPLHTFADYELLEEIGHGGMGVIFKARQRSLGRIVAVKLIRAGALARRGDIVRFQTEAAAAARLHHPNIVAIYEVGEYGGRHFYSMEYVPGNSLAHKLLDGPFPPREAARLLHSVAKAIQFAHEQGVLHRDLKPANILLDASHEPRVADFGLAKLLDSDSGLTLSGAVIGSPQYMPPEQARGGSAKAAAQCDVYALGAILYELLTGRPPFNAPTPLETMKLVVEQEAINPRALNPAVPLDLETICLKCLAKEPGARYATAQELADELSRFLDDEPIRARRIGGLERAWRWCRRKPALAALSAVLAIAPPVIISILLVMGGRVTAERNRSLEQLYVTDVALAGRALDVDDYAGAWRSLAAHFPTSQPRGHASPPSSFEWRYLWAKAQGDALATIPAHRSIVFGVTYSADGKYAASASSDGTNILWDAATGRPLRSFTEAAGIHELGSYSDQMDDAGRSAMYSVSFAANSHNLLTGANGLNGMILWDADSGQRRWVLVTNSFTMGFCSPTDPNLALAIVAYPRTNLALINLATGRPVKIFNDGRADTVCFSPDGRMFARWNRDTRIVLLQNIPDGKVLGTIDCGAAYVISMAFTPDGRTLALADMKQDKVELFDVTTQKSIGNLVSGTGRLWSIAISPDGRWLASGSHDETIRLWDLASKKEARKFLGHRGLVETLAFSPDSRRLVSGGHDGAVRFWDVDPPAGPAAITNAFDTFAFSNDGTLVLTQGTNSKANLWHLPDQLLAHEWSVPKFQSAVSLPNGEWLLACQDYSNGPACLRLATSSIVPREVIPLQGVPSLCSAIALSADGSLVATGHADGTVAVWRVDGGKLLYKKGDDFVVLNKPVPLDSLAFSGNDELLAGASFYPARLRTWKLSSKSLVGAHAFRNRYPMPVAVSPDGTSVATSGNGQGFSINLWDSMLADRKSELRGHLDVPKCIAFSPDGQTLATGGTDGMLKLWNLPTHRELLTMATFERGVLADRLVFSPNGEWLGAGDTQGVLHLYHAPQPAALTAAASR